jgi:hypothetical protein
MLSAAIKGGFYFVKQFSALCHCEPEGRGNLFVFNSSEIATSRFALLAMTASEKMKTLFYERA